MLCANAGRGIANIRMDGCVPGFYTFRVPFPIQNQGLAMNLADRLQRKVALAFLLFLAWVYPAHSQEWPDHEVQVIVP